MSQQPSPNLLHQLLQEEDTRSLNVSLLDFDQLKSDHVLFDQLKNKMRNYQKTIPFAMKFNEIKKIDSNKNHGLRFPSDVKISHTHNFVCVADDANKEIKFFDLTSLEYLTAFPIVGRCMSLVIEENFNNDAIYFRCSNGLGKYRVKDLLKLGNEAECIWSIETNHQYGMAIREIGNRKQLFRFNNMSKEMDVIDTTDGKIIAQLKLENLSRIVDVKFLRPNRMIVSDLAVNACFIYDEINPNEWKLIRTINQVDNIPCSQPLGFAIDRTGKKFFLSDYDNKRILVFDLDGNLIHSHIQDSTSTLSPFGMDFDEKSGLLFIADQQAFSIRIFE
ncbi:predicted protein [Naegleria gruberi]|uniref:Predicted protein n=1 Tax=Naegleria gruberi TaxID=5762 RepID=D2V978_NAEGR|nr:uncharacterized protein NAEGRDRAFT_65593 [Naegleria gruberi]EFC46663.1 predicted protein [Naegleria gruberi]|eukprot:XP_002679407.1 predicted protein [Naegleria gruberi strain NEG-M]